MAHLLHSRATYQAPRQSEPLPEQTLIPSAPIPSDGLPGTGLPGGSMLPGGSNLPGGPMVPGGPILPGKGGMPGDPLPPGNPFPPGGKGGKGGKGGLPPPPFFAAPFSNEGRAHADAARLEQPRISRFHPYVMDKRETRNRLGALGLLPTSSGGHARIHIDDRAAGHGAQVLRAASGPLSLASAADASLNTAGPPVEFAKANLTPEQFQRMDVGMHRISTGDTLSELTAGAADTYEAMILQKKLAVQHTREALPADGKPAFLNMSWGTSPDRLATQIAHKMLSAPADSPLFAKAEEMLGRRVVRKADRFGGWKIEKAELTALKKAGVSKAVADRLGTDENQKRFAVAREALGDEVAAARKANLLVFAAAGNEHDLASDAGTPEMSVTASAGVPGLIRVGATDQKAPGMSDDEISEMSGAGQVSVSAPGEGIPVAVEPDPEKSRRHRYDIEGTSFASPIAVETAWAMSAANPDLDVDQIAALMTDSRAVRDLEGTTRDGAGAIDQFAAVVLAKNPSLTQTQIDALRTALDAPDADGEALRKQYGLD